jgi:hypothetical protein
MKTYSGQRTIDGIKVTVDGQALDECFAIEVFDEQGFEWSYEGSAPRQLAFAILVDHLQNSDRAKEQTESFMKAVVANLDTDWALSTDQIQAALAGAPGN